MPALIIQRMVFTAGTSAGPSVLRLIVSQIEPWVSEHPLLFSESTCSKMLRTGMLGSKEQLNNVN